MADIVHCKKLIVNMGDLVVDGMAAVKGGKLAEIKGVFKLLGDLKDVVVELKAALPELKDLDANESLELAQEVYALAGKLGAPALDLAGVARKLVGLA